MGRAIELALGGLYSTGPNPRVGCVLVKNNMVVAEGFHLWAGEGHAEVRALENARLENIDPEFSTAYVTLEPCSHHGRTPPCCLALIAAKVSRVVVAMLDPNPLVAGKGIEKLRAAGIQVDVGILENEARTLNPGFIKRMQQGLPLLRVKMAMSIDGRTAMASGESQWITGAAARSDGQRLRAQSCAIMSGVDTVITDDAALTVRTKELGLDTEAAKIAVHQQPLRVILDSRLRLPVTAKILSQPGHTVVVAAQKNAEAEQALVAAGAEVIYLPDSGTKEARIDLQRLLQRLAQGSIAGRTCNEVLLEAGSKLAGAMTQADLVDCYILYMAPTFLGSSALPLLTLPLDKMSQQRRLQVEAITRVGDDWRIEAWTQR